MTPVQEPFLVQMTPIQEPSLVQMTPVQTELEKVVKKIKHAAVADSQLCSVRTPPKRYLLFSWIFYELSGNILALRSPHLLNYMISSAPLWADQSNIPPSGNTELR